MMKRFAAWLARWAGVMPTVEETRIRSGGDAVERGMRWETFYREEGGLADMIAALRKEAFEAAAELDPKDTDKIYYWATADRNLRRLEAKILTVIATGKTVQMQTEEAERAAKLRVVKSVW